MGGGGNRKALEYHAKQNQIRNIRNKPETLKYETTQTPDGGGEREPEHRAGSRGDSEARAPGEQLRAARAPRRRAARAYGATLTPSRSPPFGILRVRTGL